MYLGIDIGTSSVKAVIIDEGGHVVGQASASLSVSRPQPLWSEQNAEDWWSATVSAIGQLRASDAAMVAAVKSVGLSGQMHGATLLDGAGQPIRPAILWNDGRSGAECSALEEVAPASRDITGNLAMPGFTAPKLLWVKNHEPENFARIAKVLLPKDYIRYRMTGEFASDLSDSAGTLWLDVAKRSWSETMLSATSLGVDHMPKLYEGTEVTGALLPSIASEWGVDSVPVAAGGGDNAAGAAGIGVVTPGTAFVSLGTSGVYFVSEDDYKPNVEGALHTFCHCVPDTWHKMAVVLSAASCLTWVCGLVGAESEQSLLDRLVARGDSGKAGATPIFLPYLSGERTPHNDPAAQGVFFGMTHETDTLDLAQSVLEGVAFALADGQDGLIASGTQINELSAIGGGARSAYWVQLIADTLDQTLHLRASGEVGPAFGAARLARLAVTKEAVGDVCTPPDIEATLTPNAENHERLKARRGLYQQLYQDIKGRFGS